MFNYCLILLLLCFSALTLAENTASDASCNVHAFSNDPDPAGLNIRSGPGSQHSIIAVIPQGGAELTITEHKNGWLKVKNIWVPAEAEYEYLEQMTGWIHGSMIAVELGRGSTVLSHPLYAAPSLESPVNKRISRADRDSYIPYSITKIHACAGTWLKVRIENKETKQQYNGWLDYEHYCGSMVTTCS